MRSWKMDPEEYWWERFRLTVEQVYEMRARGCGVCGVMESVEAAGGKELAIDHDHATWQPRGALCDRHNRLVGMYEAGRLKNAGLIKECADYIERTTDNNYVRNKT